MEHIIANIDWLSIGWFFGYLMGFTTAIALHVTMTITNKMKGMEEKKKRDENIREINNYFDDKPLL